MKAEKLQFKSKPRTWGNRRHEGPTPTEAVIVCSHCLVWKICVVTSDSDRDMPYIVLPAPPHMILGSNHPSIEIHPRSNNFRSDEGRVISLPAYRHTGRLGVVRTEQVRAGSRWTFLPISTSRLYTIGLHPRFDGRWSLCLEDKTEKMKTNHGE